MFAENRASRNVGLLIPILVDQDKVATLANIFDAFLVDAEAQLERKKLASAETIKRALENEFRQQHELASAGGYSKSFEIYAAENREKFESLFSERIAHKEARLRYRLGKLHIRAVLTDGTSIELKKFDDLEHLPNSGRKMIGSLKASAEDYEGNSFSVELSTRRYETCAYEISGNYKTVSHISARLDDYFESLSPWYSRFAKLSGTVIGSTLYISIIVLLIGLAVFGILIPPAETTTEPLTSIKILGALAIVSLMVLPFLFSYIWTKTQAHLFPMALFAIGDGKRRYNRMIFLQRSAGGILASGILGLLGIIWRQF